MTVSLRHDRQPVITRTLEVDEDCEFGFTTSVAKSKVKSAKKLALRIAFRGNDALAATTFVGSTKVKR